MDYPLSQIFDVIIFVMGRWRFFMICNIFDDFNYLARIFLHFFVIAELLKVVGWPNVCGKNVFIIIITKNITNTK